MRVALPPDAELVGRLRDGDEAAFALLLDQWSPGMLRLARSFVSTPDSAAEVVQDTWMAVLQALDRFEGRSSLRTWVYRILVNTAKRRAARERRFVPMSSLRPAATGPTVDPDRFQGPDEPYPGHWRTLPSPWPDLVPSPEQRTLDAELQARLEDALAGLPERQRAVITLRDVQGRPAEEVCAILEISPANQRVLLHRARAHVRARLEVYLDAR
ncbi:RNA polymerase sigma-70 factor (ECF subfamily) [Pseudonocardia hierapolitana]|uniref:RNA polymerase sigma-70 factor (ECF subfamily) n=1 Tax=Pseudonocardia hierapolitana TaxID=1128676 RepID=A0A561SV11_9PSEU|nr:sigma-70 family RNA polymerase sigma factor [Pseudonocardia hierapolitana]TWF78682.1 RNA polymerase sigma-70 factor (ECF subfamily) [Pseudonocardia hierapolitana]